MSTPTGQVTERVGLGRWIGLPAAVLLICVGIAILLTPDLTGPERRNLNWQTLSNRTLEHLQLSLTAALIVVLVAIPVGVLLTRPALRKAEPVTVGIANFGQAAPAIGLLVIVASVWETGFWPAVTALTIYGMLPVLASTIVGLQGVDARLVEAARGMGMTQASVLFRVELPMAVPVMMSGVRTALVLITGTAALAGFIGGGGLGLIITTGINLQLPSVIIVGAALVAALALLIDWVGRIIEEAVRPKGLG